MANTPATSSTSAGNGRFVSFAFTYALASLSAADVLKDFVVPFPFKLVDIRMVPTTVASTGGKAATLTAKIDGTAVSGAVLSLTTSNMGTIGVYQTGTATDVLAGGNNIAYSAGSKITVTGSAVTAFAEGQGVLVINVQSLDA